MDVRHVRGVQGRIWCGRQLGGGDEPRRGVWVDEHGGVVRRGGGVVGYIAEQGDDWRRERQREWVELRDEKVRCERLSGECVISGSLRMHSDSRSV